MDREIIKKITLELVEWCRNQLLSSGGDKAVIGLSGGKDSTVTAALMAEAIGKDNVYGFILPDDGQNDLKTALEIGESLGINTLVLDIAQITAAFHNLLSLASQNKFIEQISEQTKLNLPPRVRMTLLYALAQSLPEARVINSSNLSEDWVGYVTIYGDTAGAFAPLGMLTSDEVIAVGLELGVKEQFLVIPPADGLTGHTDEEVFGFSYRDLNNYIRTGKLADQDIKAKIDRMHKISRFKFLPLPMYRPPFLIAAKDIAKIYQDHQ